MKGVLSEKILLPLHWNLREGTKGACQGVTGEKEVVSGLEETTKKKTQCSNRRRTKRIGRGQADRVWATVISKREHIVERPVSGN